MELLMEGRVQEREAGTGEAWAKSKEKGARELGGSQGGGTHKDGLGGW